MRTKISRRQLLGIGAATIAGAALSKATAHATNHDASGADYQPVAAYNPQREGDRPYWEKSYSGGPVDVKPLAPVLPGKGYKPVVVPNGAALPFKIIDGVKVFHLIAEEVDHEFDAGIKGQMLGIQWPGEQHRDRSGRRRARADLCDQPFTCRDVGPLAWRLSAQRHGRRRRPHPAIHQSRVRR